MHTTLEDATASASTDPAGGVALALADSRPPTWDEIVRRHTSQVYHLALRLSGNTQDAEDLTQDTFLRVFRSLDSYRPGTFEGWLHRITTNLYLDMVRHRSVLHMQALPEGFEPVASPQGRPEVEYDIRHLSPELERALDSLSPDFRLCILLCDVVGLSYEEISAALGVKMGTIRSRIHRARAQLRSQLNRHDGELRFIASA